ncbi:MAG: tRNA glutamyl-Q(34) synthetase GluQRS [Sideroxydans sp.]|nr:tRNA glutamyl-Q(34) synthetase GluQRS [Sideroxydans sp.]
MASSTEYRGRFAPSPTGPLHLGSLVAAVGSYLDAKHHHGTWLVRMEDLDTPRCLPGAAEDILRTLEAFELHSDEPVIYQSQRTAAYEVALRQLHASGAVYACSCTRKEIADSALLGIEGFVYPGTCRNAKSLPHPSPLPGGEGTIAARVPAWRVRTDILPSVRPELVEGHSDQLKTGFDRLSPNGSGIEFDDELQGHITQHLESQIGDFVVKRADGLFAYQLAVVVDDAFQHITHVVRGADLLASTPRQIYMQRLLGLHTPHYMHLPVAVNKAGEKLSKQTLAAPVDVSRPVTTLLHVLEFLQQRPPAELGDGDIGDVLVWAILNWDAKKLFGMKVLPARF